MGGVYLQMTYFRKHAIEHSIRQQRLTHANEARQAGLTGPANRLPNGKIIPMTGCVHLPGGPTIAMNHPAAQMVTAEEYFVSKAKADLENQNLTGEQICRGQGTATYVQMIGGEIWLFNEGSTGYAHPGGGTVPTNTDAHYALQVARPHMVPHQAPPMAYGSGGGVVPTAYGNNAQAMNSKEAFTAQTKEDPMVRIDKLDRMYNAGYISKEDYEKRKNEILQDI